MTPKRGRVTPTSAFTDARIHDYNPTVSRNLRNRSVPCCFTALSSPAEIFVGCAIESTERWFRGKWKCSANFCNGTLPAQSFSGQEFACISVPSKVACKFRITRHYVPPSFPCTSHSVILPCFCPTKQPRLLRKSFLAFGWLHRRRTFYTSHVGKVDDERVRTKYCCNRSVNFPSPSINNKIKVYSFRSAHRVKQTANNVSLADWWLFVRATFSRRENRTVDKSVGELFEESNRKVIRQGSWRYPISFCSYSFLVSVHPGTRILSPKLPSSSFTRSWFKVYSPDGTPFVEKLLAE